MKIYTIYSPSHKKLFDEYFLKSLPNEFEVISREIPQECKTGKFYDDGWSETCYRKVKFFLDACNENMGEVFVFSDVDVQFFGSIKEILLEELGDFDIAAQNDTGNYYCSGFWVCKGNERTLRMFESMLVNYTKEDQTTMNQNIHLCKSKFLSRKFFTIAHLNGRVWNGEDFNIPYDILVHHANWTVGIDNKIKLLDKVRKKINNRK